MKKILLLVLLLFCLTARPKSVKLEDLPPRPFATDVVLMCLDHGLRQEREFGAISAPLGSALQAKAAIIITTAGLMADIIGLNKKFAPKPDQEPSPDWLDYKPEEWQSFYLTAAPDIYVLIPRGYKPPRAIEPSLGQDFALGLHLNRLTPISGRDMLSQKFHQEHTKTEEEFSKRLVPALEKLFVTKKEWGTALSRIGKPGLKNLYTYQPIYAFYIVGHGAQFRSIDQELVTIRKLAEKEGIEAWQETIDWLTSLKNKKHLYSPDSQGVIAGIDNTYFKRLLQFIDKKLASSLVFYDTCNGGGWNLLEITAAYRYSYIMISGALMGAEVLGFSSPHEFDFVRFVAQLYSYDPIDFRELLSTIYLFADLDELRQAQKAANIPLLVLPGQKPVPLNIPGQVVSIGSTLAKNRNPDDPLNISTAFAGRYLDKQSAERASRAALKREAKRKKLYKEWLTKKGLTDIANKPIDPKVYKEWLGILKDFNEKYQKNPAVKAPAAIYPHAITLYADKIQFPLMFTANPNDRQARPPALIPMAPLLSYTDLKSIVAPDFTVKQIVRSSLLNFPSLQESRIFEVQKLIARNDIPQLGHIETEKPAANVYYKVLAVNQAPQSGLSEKTERNALVVKYVDDNEQEAVKIAFRRVRSDKAGATTLAGDNAKVKVVLETEAIEPENRGSEWEKFIQYADQLYKTTENVLPPAARASRA